MAGQLRLPELPLFVTRQNKILVGMICYMLCTILYILPNHYPIFPPQHLPMTRYDALVPFIPQAVFVYVTEYFLFIFVYLLARDELNLNKYAYSFLFQQALAVTVFMLWPTVYPRELFPLVRDNLDAATYYVFSHLRQADAPTNCLPSLHVSSVFLSSFVFLDEQPKKFPFFVTWASLIALSTLPTKQHYIIDVVTGFLLAVASYLVFHRLMRYRPRKAR